MIKKGFNMTKKFGDGFGKLFGPTPIKKLLS